MRRLAIIAAIFLIISCPCKCQDNSPSNHVGINAVPIFDFLKMYPENQIKGAAIDFNYGKMVSKNISFGVNLYYSGVSNEYKTESIDLHKERQEIKIIGISPNLRYHFRIKKKLILYGQVSLGFGNYNEKTTNLLTSEPVNYGNENESILLMTAGIGMNYFFFKNIALDINVPYIYLNRLSTQQYVEDFHTVAPMLGIQFSW